MRFKILPLLLILFQLNLCAQIKKKVLFLGNSYTYVNDLPQLIKEIALSKGDTLIYDQIVIGGYTFQNHWASAATYTKIKSNVWDVIVIQGQSQEPSFSPTQVMNNSYPYAKRLADSARTVNVCTEVMYYMTWGRKNGDASNCAAYPPVCTYTGMTGRLRQSYLMFADSFNASCAPAGVAWKTFRNLYPSVELYQPDDSHPSLEGSYLTACVFYSSIFKKTAAGASYYSTLNQTVAQNMQLTGSTTVMDSASTWNLSSHIPTANFTYSLVSGNTFQFINNSVNATSYNWSFGSVQNSPQFTFGGSPPYTITLTAVNGCTNHSTSQVVSLTGLEKQPGCENKMWYSNETAELKINWCNSSENAELVISNITGVREKAFNNPGETMDLSFLKRGIYLVEIIQSGKRNTIKIIRQ